MAEQTSNYPTLRRTRATLRVIAPIVSLALCLTGLSLFLGQAPKLMNEGFALSERLIFGVIGLVYLIGLPLVGFVLLFVLRAGADLIDVWIDSAVAAEKTADLMERQLVPGIERLCKLLERGPIGGDSVVPRAAASVTGEPRRQISDAARR
jgi:hypothetical protein